MWNPKCGTGDWDRRVQPNPGKPTGWRVQVRVGPPRVNGSGFWTGLKLKRSVFAVQTRTASGLPGPVANINQGLVNHSRNETQAETSHSLQLRIWDLPHEWRGRRKVERWADACQQEYNHCWWQWVCFDEGRRVRACQCPWYRHACGYLLRKFCIRIGYFGPSLENAHSKVWEKPGWC